MKLLYGSLEQVLQMLRKGNYKTEEIPLTLVPEYSSLQVIKEFLQRGVHEKNVDNIFHVSLLYVSAASRVIATCSAKMNGKQIVNWVVEEIKPRKVASFALIVHPKEKAPRESNIYLFTVV